jgi:ATP/maltotriose-dependent transcriptional regulator MalT
VGQCNSFDWEGWAAHLQGDLKAATAAFGEEEALLKKHRDKFLYAGRRLYDAENLRRTGKAELARQVTRAIKDRCRQYRWVEIFIGCERLLGELAAAAGQDQEAQGCLHRSLETARSISHKPLLIEALAAQGRWLARRGEAAAARRDLEEGLGYATAGGYRIYEVDLRVGLAWASFHEGKKEAARQEADLALTMSREMGYYWGEVDAQEVLDALANFN